ncbi:MAG: sensor histidine kinase [Sutterella sp.]|nr:sensor histidine kinase [Sutterella sp.]
MRVSAQLAESAPIEGEPLELELLTVNLLKNALHAARTNTTGKSEIRVRLTEDSSRPDAVRWVLEVEDNGLPVSDDKLAERHAARLTFRRASPQGLIASVSMTMRRTKAG